MTSSAGRFGSDPAYQAALDAAARSSVLAATSGLSALSVTPTTATSSSTAASKAPFMTAKSLGAGRTASAAAPKQISGTAAVSTSTASGSHGYEPKEPAAPEHAQAAADKALGRRHSEPKKAVTAPAGTSKDKAGAEVGSLAGDETGGSNGSGGKGKAAVAKEAMPGRYSEHLDQAELQRGFKSGQVFRGKMRVNAGDRREAYITIPGLPHDVLLRGDACQNRAVEGDEVAVALQPLAAWFTVNKLAAQLPPGANSNDAVLAALKSCGADLSDDAPWQRCTNADEVKTLVAKLAAARPELRITGKVVAILTPSPKREHVVGLLQLGAPAAGVAPLSSHPLPAAVAALQAAGSSSGSASTVPSSAVPTCYLVPLDPRLPRCVVRPSELKNLPTALLEELVAGPDKAENRTLMSARIAEWSSSHNQPAVTLRASLGQAGEIESETAALLEMEGIRSGDFEPDVLACLPPTPWRITEADIASRRDFRSTRIFSIDPPTAKDLDDALSISPLPGGGWRVGVHIADVAHFIPPFSALDVEAGKRATSTYLVQRVIPMLPPLLCEELCSLNPGVERFAFSVEWELDDKGAIKSTWFGRSVIRSCAKLSYPLVQAMIEGRFDPATCPVQLHGGATWDQVVGDSLALWGLAKQMRAARFAGGALRLDGVRLFYQLDKDGNPLTAAPYVQQEANQLVEEFMLLANMSVADCIADTFRDRAMLRRHPPPNATKLKVLQEVAAAAGLPIDISSAASIHNGLNELRRAAAAGGAAGAASSSASRYPGPEAEEGDQAAVRSGLVEAGVLGNDLERNRRTVELLVMLATRPMQLAEYFCTGLVDDEAAWRHYALAVRAYTHFTSPIRRYPDVVVHRLLAAALEVRAGRMSVEEATKEYRLLDTRLAGMVADHCNDRRLAARNAQDGSLKLYLCVLLRRQPVVTMGTVSSLGGDRYFAVYIPEFGHEVRVELEEAGVPLQANFNPGTKVLTLTRGGTAGGEGVSNGGNSTSGSMGRQRKGFASSASSRGGSHGHNGRRQQHGGGGQDGKEVPDLATWISSLAAPPRNPHGLQPARLPLHLRLFSDVPVVLTAVSVPGEPSQLVARMYLPEAEEAAGIAATKAAGVAKVKTELETAVSQSQISWENQLND